MKRALLACGLLLSSSFALAQDVLHVWNWNDYIDPKIVAKFEADTGIKVEYRTYSSVEQLNKLLAESNDADVIVPSQDMLPTLINEKKLQPLKSQLLPNSKHLDSKLFSRLGAYDKGNKFAVPYLWGTAGLAVNTKLAEAALGKPLPNSWGVLFDPEISGKLAQCGIGMIDAPEEAYAAAVAYQQGRSLAETSPRQLEQANNLLKTLRPKLRYIDSERYISDLESGKLCVAFAWVGDAARAEQAGQPVKFLIPDEGSTLFIDSLAIPAKADRADLAHRFIDYMMRPEVSAAVTNTVLYPSANRDAEQFVDAKLRGNQGLFPSSEVMRRIYLLPSLSLALNAAKSQMWDDLLR